MSQTVEFEYAIGEMVRIKSQTMPNQTCEQVGTIVAQQNSRSGQQFFSVEWGEGASSTVQQFMGQFLAPMLPPEPVSAAPAPAFPRVIWQSGPVPTSLAEELGDDDERPYRLIQVEECRFVDEVYGRDAMGARRWRALPPKHNADWLRDAIVEKLERQAKAAELRRQSESNGD